MRNMVDAKGNLPVWYGEKTSSVAIKESTLEKLKVFGAGYDWDEILDNVMRVIQRHAPAVAESPWLGTNHAQVTIQEFSDFECHYCMEVLPTVKKVLEKYEGKIKVVFRNYPRTLKHLNALHAHIAALCAHDQEKFWEYHDELFKNQDNLTPEVTSHIAAEIGLDMELFTTCLKKKEHVLRIFLDKQEGYDLGVRRVPTFYVKGEKLEGNVSFEEFAGLIDRVLGDHK